MSETVDAQSIRENLGTLNDQYLSLQRQAAQEISAINAKYAPQYADLIVQRTTLLETRMAESEKKEGDELPLRLLPRFWKEVLLNLPILEGDIEKHDYPVLDYISNISATWLDADRRTGFTLTFDFDENPYFENEQVVKTYRTKPASTYCDDLIIERIEVTPIEWFPKMDVTMGIPKAGKKKGGKKMAPMPEPRESFFRVFFRELDINGELPDDVINDSDSEDAEDEDVLELLITDEYEKGCAFIDSIIPHAYRFFDGTAQRDADACLSNECNGCCPGN